MIFFSTLMVGVVTLIGMKLQPVEKEIKPTTLDR